MKLPYGFLFRVICFEYRVCSIEYFLDKMQLWELSTVIDDIKWLDKNQRLADRYKLYAAMQPNSKKKIDLKELMPLPWDKDEEWSDEYKEEELKRKREAAERLAAVLQQMNEITN